MGVTAEFFKIKEGFKKVREDMNYLSEKISENYDDFFKKHKIISLDVENLTLELKKSLEHLNKNHINKEAPKISEKELLDIKSEIKHLKKEIVKIQDGHHNLINNISDIKNNKTEIKKLKEKLNSSELEIFLLKERLIEKDVEIKQVKEISKHLFNVLEDLSKTELELLNLKTNENLSKK